MTDLILAAALASRTQPIDESFHVDRRSQTNDRTNFEYALDAEVDRPLQLRIGAAVSGGRFHAVLLGVTCDVRFHADLTPITNVIDRHAVVTP
ncbi:MAG: hypothetical protein M3N13_02545 [Candidatus Eremiobacteraeota bacterium]|nr:hypothetical protein [Candidatus Eremiobacteraeota bacterium]